MTDWLESNPIYIEGNHSTTNPGAPVDWSREVNVDGTIKGGDGQINLFRGAVNFFDAPHDIPIGYYEIDELIERLREVQDAIAQEIEKVRDNYEA